MVVLQVQRSMRGEKRHFDGFVDGVRVVNCTLLPSGEVEWICTFAQFQRRGYASALWRWMVAQGEEPMHSRCRLPEGDRWARKVGGIVPPLHSLPCAACNA